MAKNLLNKKLLILPYFFLAKLFYIRAFEQKSKNRYNLSNIFIAIVYVFAIKNRK